MIYFSSQLQHFAASRFLSSKIAVAGVGVDIVDVAQFGSCLGKDGAGKILNFFKELIAWQQYSVPRMV